MLFLYHLQIVKMMIALVVLYFLTITPGRLVVLIGPQVTRTREKSTQVVTLAEMMRSLNSCVNIVVYTVMSE